MPASRRLPMIAVAVLALVALSACDPSGAPTPSPTSSVTRTASATPTPTPSPTADGSGGGGGGGSAALTCDSILSPSVRAEFDGGGLLLMPPAEFFAKVRSEIPAGYVSPWLFFEDNGGIVCNWHTGFEVVGVYGYMDLPADQYPAFRDALLNSGDGYTMEESDAVLFSVPADSGNPFSYVLVTDGPTYVGTTIALIDDMKAIVP